jgi:hypothetical protein
MRARLSRFVAVSAAFLPLLFSGCGGSSSTIQPPPPATYTIGGTISGLTGTGLVLQNNGGDNLAVSANGVFTFHAPVASGATYNVTIYARPSNQTCTVSNPSGTVIANVTNIQIACSAAPQYTIGGNVSGLSGSGLVLQDNGSDNLAVSANGAFTFSTTVAYGSSYLVTVNSQPSSQPGQLCSVSNGSGTATANVTNVQVSCSAISSAPGQWTWMGGSSSQNRPGVYGTLGVAASSNIPGARVWSAYWTDLQGNFWLFGGIGIDSANKLGELNDLWKYSNGEWTWMAGSNFAGEAGVYGTLGQQAPGNTPGARNSATTWVDPQGNLWLFGGMGVGGTWNDLWKYANDEWTWENGSNVGWESGGYQGAGIYGTLGVPDPSNLPGVRSGASGWTDSEGNLWLFGGTGINAQGSAAVLNDLWKFSSGEWTWMGGSNISGDFPVYGTKGTPDPANAPHGRYWSTTWTDAQGNFWLFGGDEWLNDLWRYSSGQWTWMSGADTADAPGFYGLEYVAAPGNAPGAREESVGWTDAQGNFWLFGGSGLDYRINPYGLGAVYGEMNDLWEYANGQWSWMSGSNLDCAAGNYGVLGTAAAANVPPARLGAASWTDKSGNLWLFGGTFLDCPAPLIGKLNDLWEFQPWGPSGPPPPPPPVVTYAVGGTVYGLAGSGLVLQDNLADNLTVSSNGSFTFPTALAAGEDYSVSILTQPSNPQQNCILLNAVGTANATVTSIQVMCATVVGGHNQWTWMGGNAPANYGTLGQPAAPNLPPARTAAASWTDASGSFWFFGGNTGWVGTDLMLCGNPVPPTYFDFNDLWKYAGGQWTWMAGSSSTSTQAGVYGIQGQPSSSNFPGARHGAVTWTDPQGNFWLFGGIGIDSAGKQGDLNDLWEYSNGQWSWVAGSNLYGQSGSYGSQGTPAAANSPGARDGAVGWTDASGNLWLFGGFGYDSTSDVCMNQPWPAGYLNDLWEFSGGQWTWIGGSNLADQSGSYGTQGTASSGNAPGARMNATAWTDQQGNFWLFGGATRDVFNDLWKYASGQWTWVAGSNTADQKGVYGILGVSASSNAPGARFSGAGFADASGDLWLFGGTGLDALGGIDSLNDLWRFSNGQWTWMGGPELSGNPGSYGILGAPSPTSLPPAREAAAAWKRADGSFWLFGGDLLTGGLYNDLWEYQP